jgi:hypothetical protein
MVRMLFRYAEPDFLRQANRLIHVHGTADDNGRRGYLEV